MIVADSEDYLFVPITTPNGQAALMFLTEHVAHAARAQRGDDFIRPQVCSRFQDRCYFPVGTRRFRSSNQFNTTLICVGSCSLDFIIRKR